MSSRPAALTVPRRNGLQRLGTRLLHTAPGRGCRKAVFCLSSFPLSLPSSCSGTQGSVLGEGEGWRPPHGVGTRHDAGARAFQNSAIQGSFLPLFSHKQQRLILMTDFCRGPRPRSCSRCSLFLYQPEVGAVTPWTGTPFSALLLRPAPSPGRFQEKAARRPCRSRARPPASREAHRLRQEHFFGAETEPPPALPPPLPLELLPTKRSLMKARLAPLLSESDNDLMLCLSLFRNKLGRL